MTFFNYWHFPKNKFFLKPVDFIYSVKMGGEFEYEIPKRFI